MLSTLSFKQVTNFLILSVLAVHVLQCMTGCESDETSAEVVIFQQCGYNGEDFMKADFKNLTWIAQSSLAKNITQELNVYQHQFLSLTCPEMLNEFVNRSALQREGMQWIFPLDLAIGLVVGLILLCFCITGLFLWKNSINGTYLYTDN
uniref:MHC class I-like antigen recognition-like domain-containing protein n=1 Tax=Poecilia latipinna TaxID=48699 RepID=A0A3B3TR95_9TELE